jgi:hypothetical protein
MPILMPEGKQSFQNSVGVPLVGGKLFTYAAGTNTPKATYTDAAGLVPNANPVVLDARGEALVYWSGAYKVVLKDALDVVIWTVDDVSGADVLDAALRADLANNASAAKGAAMVAFLRSLQYPGGTVGYKLRQITSVKDFGAIGDGVADDTAAMNAAHATGLLIYYPAGDYKFTPTITIPDGGIIGDGPKRTRLISTEVGTANWIKFTGSIGLGYDTRPTFHNFSVIGNPAKTGGAAIQFLPATGESSYADFHNVDILSMPICLDMVAASHWKATACNFLSYTIAGIQVANTNVADSGDSAVMASYFSTPGTAGSGIWQKSSGGLKIIGNKFLGGARAYTMALEASTSVLVIVGNSMENMAQQDIVLTQATPGAVFVNAVIAANEFSVGGVAIATDASGFLTELNINGNQINMGGVGSNPCIALNAVTDLLIDGNLIRGNGGAGSSAISITNCANGKVGVNAYANLPNPISITGSPTVMLTLDVQSGVAPASATSGWTTYGNLFLGPEVTVTFPAAWLDPPADFNITLMSATGNGCIGGVVTAVTATTFTFRPLSAITSIAAVCYWQCRGII